MVICGIDEAGRGPIAGPVTAAAVILTDRFPFDLLDDSKKLSEARRVHAAKIILREARACAVGWAWPEEIDTINILQASLLAMARAFELLPFRPEKVLVDGPYAPQLDVPTEAIIHGDSFVKEIEAASILAKTARDRWMIRYSWIDDRYGFQRHKGYPTQEHRRLCIEHGLSSIHRKSFRILPSS
jgi:ribonuclease HII